MQMQNIAFPVLLLALAAISAASVPITPKQFKADTILKVGYEMGIGYEDISDEQRQYINAATDAQLDNVPNDVRANVAHGRKLAETQVDPKSKADDVDGLTMDINVLSKGPLYYDYPNRKQAMNLTEIDAELVMFGGIKIDFRIMANGGSILRYDQHRNYTWGIIPFTHEEICLCSTLNATMFPLFLPPIATWEKQMRYVGPDGKAVTVDVYTASIARGVIDIPTVVGIEIEFKMDWYVDKTTDPANPVLRYYNASMKAEIAGPVKTVQMRLSFVYEMYNVMVGQPVLSVFEVDPQICKCDAPPLIPNLPGAPGSCPSPPQGCQCFPTPPQYCSMVNFPTDLAIDAPSTDSFVQQSVISAKAVFFASGQSMSADCEAEFKSFYCLFFFPRCTRKGTVFTIDLPASLEYKCGPIGANIIHGVAKQVGSQYTVLGGPTATATATSSSDPHLAGAGNADTVRAESPFQAYRAANQPGGLAGPAIAGIVIGTVVGLALIAVVAGIVQYHHRYEAWPWSKRQPLIDHESGGKYPTAAQPQTQYESTGDYQ